MNIICKKLWSGLDQHEMRETSQLLEIKKYIADKLNMPSNFSLVEPARLTRISIGKNEEIQLCILQFVNAKKHRFVMITDPNYLKEIRIQIDRAIKDMEMVKANKTHSDDLNKNIPIN